MPLKAPSIPDGLDLITSPAGVIIRRRWFTLLVIPMLIFAVVWDGFLVFWYSAALFSGKHTPWIAVFFPLGHVAVGIGISYYVLCTFFNVTDVILSPDSVKVSTHPLPWAGNRTISLRDIRDTAIRTRNSSNRGANNLVLMYVDETNRERKLVTGLSEWDHAEYIEWQIRRAVGLPEKE